MRKLSARICAVVVLVLGLSVILYRNRPYADCWREEAYCENVNLDWGQKPSSAKGNAARPKILIWAKPMHCIGYTLADLPNGDGGCDITFDRTQYTESHAVVFFMKCCFPNDLPDPKLRRPDQAFVWWAQESPWTVLHFYHQTLTDFNNYFNWTMAYRTDSDVLGILWPVPSMDYLLMRLGRKEDMIDKHLEMKPTLTEEEFRRDVKHLLSLKISLVAWTVTNCKATVTAKRRTAVATSLENEGRIQIDRFGKCGTRPIPLNNTILFDTLSTYKFYLAFENSYHCEDYVTEKTTYNSFIAGNVPIIFGPTSANAARILPKHSYIHVEDFNSYEELGKYLRYLDKNDTAYKEYFNWWKDPGAQTYPRFGFNYGRQYLPDESSYRRLEKYESQDDWQDIERFGLYHLCRKLKNEEHLTTSKTVPNLADWFYRSDDADCYT